VARAVPVLVETARVNLNPPLNRRLAVVTVTYVLFSVYAKSLLKFDLSFFSRGLLLLLQWPGAYRC